MVGNSNQALLSLPPDACEEPELSPPHSVIGCVSLAIMSVETSRGPELQPTLGTNKVAPTVSCCVVLEEAC